MLYRKWETEDGHGTRLQLVLPRSLVPDVLSDLHDVPSAGHLGVAKTVERVREQFYWYGLQSDVEDWCEKCTKRKSPQTNVRAPLVSSCLGYPFERIAIDIMAPLPVTESGNKYILVVGDYFTKWKEAYVSHHQCDWDGHLPLVMMAYRSSIHEVQLPVDVMFGRQPNHQLEVSEYVRDLRDTLEEVHEHAREHLRTAQKR